MSANVEAEYEVMSQAVIVALHQLMEITQHAEAPEVQIAAIGLILEFASLYSLEDPEEEAE